MVKHTHVHMHKLTHTHTHKYTQAQKFPYSFTVIYGFISKVNISVRHSNYSQELSEV